MFFVFIANCICYWKYGFRTSNNASIISWKYSISWWSSC